MRSRLPLVLVLLTAACAGEYDNPFANSGASVVPPADTEIAFVSVPSGGAARDLFAVDESGAPVTRLTACNREGRPCDLVEPAFSPERARLMLRRRTEDTNNDGRLTTADGASLVFTDLARGTEQVLVEATQNVSGVDWGPAGSRVVYSAIGEGGRDDMFVMDPNGTNADRLTATADVDERRPRIDPSGSVAVYERSESGGKGRIFLYASETAQQAITQGGEGTVRLTGTPYVVGGDADPDYAPDGRTVVFRRLTSGGNSGLGHWDIMTVKPDGTDLRVVAGGPGYRGAPDWGPLGIVFAETDDSGQPRIIVIGNGGARRVALTTAAASGLQFPRWLP
jgi:Tol biopolymer transport system component